MAVPRVASAQSGFSLDQFQPSERGSEWFSTESLDLRGHLRPTVGVVGDWAYQPLVVADSGGHVRDDIVKDQFYLHLGASLVLWDRLRVAASLPVLAFEDGTTSTIAGTTFASPSSSAGVGDLRLGADVRVFGEYGDKITGAAGFDLTLPTGSRGSYSGDGNVRVLPRILVAGDIGPFVYAAKLGVAVDGLSESYGGGQLGTNIFFAASAGVRLANKKLVVGPEIFGQSVVADGAFFSKAATPVEGVLGAHYTIVRDWRAGAGVSTGLTSGLGSPSVRGLLSVEWAPAFAPPDRDHDGVPDSEDACPAEAGVRTSDPATNGCPADRDHDGVRDAEDACPDVPGVRTSHPKTNGCPPDRDHDGVLDVDDACPDVPGVPTSDPKTNGCPPPSDRDHDGVLDEEDACPDVPGLRTSDPKTNGCPEDKDRDKDGIANDVDACPDEAGPANADPKKNGCPAAFVKDGQIQILEQVKFQTGSAEIVAGPDSEAVLGAVVKVLSSHREIASIRVEGHTDDRGNAALNKKLSADRAASVVKWLVAHGIDKARLTSEGYGSARPIDSNATDAGRKNNRRVEFHIAR